MSFHSLIAKMSGDEPRLSLEPFDWTGDGTPAGVIFADTKEGKEAAKAHAAMSRNAGYNVEQRIQTIRTRSSAGVALFKVVVVVVR